MADDADIAQNRQQEIMDIQLRNIRHSLQNREIRPMGKCRYCSEPFMKGDDRIFCDADCAHDFAKFEHARKQRVEE